MIWPLALFMVLTALMIGLVWRINKQEQHRLHRRVVLGRHRDD